MTYRHHPSGHTGICDYASCSRPFDIPTSAKGKRFCSTQCRNAWHSAQRAEALATMRSQQAAANSKEDQP